MRRREFLSSVVAGSAAASAVGAAGTAGAVGTDDGTIAPMAFDSAASLLDADGQPLTDESLVAVWAAATATNTDADGDGDAVAYPGDVAIPMAAVEGSVLALGGTLVEDDTDYGYGNEEFLLNAWDDLVGGGTVLWDESHGQFYTKDRFGTFETYVEEAGYDLQASSDLLADLPDADGVVVTSPSNAFTDEELSALSSFVADGGALFLHHQSDFRNFDETDNLNAVASALELSIRFNDDQVVDEQNNAGVEFVPVTDRFNDGTVDYFDDRDGLELSPGDTYDATVTSVTDGDTVDLRLDDGRKVTVRVLGIDTPESESARQFERSQEWYGIDDVDYLVEQAAVATERAEQLLAGESVELRFDENEPVRDDFGRVLGYLTYEDDDGNDWLFNRRMVAEGLARTYGSGFTLHDEFRRIERAARAEGRGLWAGSDPGNSDPIRNDEVTELFFPTASSVRTRWGPIGRHRVPVTATGSAEQTLTGDDDDGGWWGGWFDDDVDYDERIPLVGVDGVAGVAMVGAPIVEESYELEEDYPVDTSGFGNFAFLTNLIDALADRDGDVLIDGGHGQFGVDYAQSSEDAAYYLRYLEGVGIELVQANDLASTDLSEYRGVVVSTPVESFTWAEARRLRRFARRGGAVVLVGAAPAPDDARENLNELAAAVGTDLRLNDDRITDPESNVDDDPSVPTTDRFDDSFDLFSPFEPGDGRTEAFAGELEPRGKDAYTYVVGDDPRTVELDLSGPDDADFDLYLSLDGREPGRGDHDRRSWRYGSEESITIGGGLVESGDELGIAVDAYSGGGAYTLTVTER